MCILLLDGTLKLKGHSSFQVHERGLRTVSESEVGEMGRAASQSCSTSICFMGCDSA